MNRVNGTIEASSQNTTIGHFQSAEELCARLNEFSRNPPSDSIIGYQQAVRYMYQISEVGRQLEIAGLTPDQIISSMEGARAVLAQSCFVKRLQSWPRGYPGDFETVEYLMTGQNRSEPGTAGWYLEEAALHSAVAQQHRNKVQHQANAIVHTVRRTNGRSRILSVACGGCLDFAIARLDARDSEVEVVLNDGDHDALSLAKQRLDHLGNRVRLLPGNILRMIREIRKEDQFDLALAGGLFDYLPDAAFIAVLRSVFKSLASHGEFVFTNIARGNYFRPWMEYGASWTLIERTGEEIEELCMKAEIPSGCVSLTRDTTRLSLLARVQK